MKSVTITLPASIMADFQQAARALSIGPQAAFGVLASDVPAALEVGRTRAPAYAAEDEETIHVRIADDLHAQLKRIPGSISGLAALIIISHGGQIREVLDTRLRELAEEAAEGAAT